MNQELEEKGYLLLKQFLRKEVAEYLANGILEEKEKGLMYDDEQVKNTSYRYNMSTIRTLHLHDQDRISSICKKILVPTYAYTRIYYQGSDLTPHKDRDACEYSITLHLQGSEPWEIYMENYTTKEHVPVLLEPGDAVIYKGCDILHYRKPFKGDYYIQCFLHYVDRNGEKYEHVEKETKTGTTFQETYVPFLKKYTFPLSQDLVTDIQKEVTEYIPVANKCHQSIVINKDNNLETLHAKITQQLVDRTLIYSNEQGLSYQYMSHDVLEIEKDGMYNYIMNSVKKFYVTTLYILDGTCSVHFPGFNKNIHATKGDLVIFPVSYAYQCSIQGDCTILRSVLI